MQWSNKISTNITHIKSKKVKLSLMIFSLNLWIKMNPLLLGLHIWAVVTTLHYKLDKSSLCIQIYNRWLLVKNKITIRMIKKINIKLTFSSEQWKDHFQIHSHFNVFLCTVKSVKNVSEEDILLKCDKSAWSVNSK